MAKKLLKNFSSLLGFFILGLSVWAIAHELRQYNYRDVLNSVATLPRDRLLLSIGLTILSYLGLSLYDPLAFRYLRLPLDDKKSIFTGFISAAATNTVGFAFLTGSAIRYRVYSAWGVSPLAIAQIIVFENISFWLGLLSVSGGMFLFFPPEIPAQLKLPFLSLRPIGVVFLLVVAAYLLGSLLGREPLRIRGHELRFPSIEIALAQLVLSCLDWIFATAVLYILLPANTPLSYPDFLGLFLLAMTAGVVSNVPGGLGVFESIILLLLSSKMSGAAVFGSLLAYRGIYYLLPLLVATALLGLYEIRSRLISRDS